MTGGCESQQALVLVAGASWAPSARKQAVAAAAPVIGPSDGPHAQTRPGQFPTAFPAAMREWSATAGGQGVSAQERRRLVLPRHERHATQGVCGGKRCGVVAQHGGG